MNIIGQLQVNQGDVQFIHVGFVTLWGGFTWLVSTGQLSQWKITRSILRFALSNHLFPYRESGTPLFLSSLNLLLYIWKYREILLSVPEYLVDSGKQDVWSISVSRVRLTDRFLYFIAYSANIFFYLLRTILGRTKSLLRNRIVYVGESEVRHSKNLVWRISSREWDCIALAFKLQKSWKYLAWINTEYLLYGGEYFTGN